jgi:hypothetical protein
MFGGIGFLLNGNMCVGVWKASLIVRLDAEDAEEALKEPHVGEFNITGRAMKGWVLVAREGLADDAGLKNWIHVVICLLNATEPKTYCESCRFVAGKRPQIGPFPAHVEAIEPLDWDTLRRLAGCQNA